MAEPIVVAPGVIVPEAALSVRATRSSGPGGQNVNKVASRVELRVDLDRAEGLPDEARARLRALAARRLDAQGRLLVTSQRTRDQHRNLEDAREKVRALVRRALVAPKRRKPTRVTAAAKAVRLSRKRRRSERKRARGPVRGEGD
ncbi:MAG: aminoacyl-tRNA hydrolase [Acidobacteria bacterium]|nr:MAG: aminoacyl-tRNA hydrolase [Acidobacteriota bacterium]